MIQNIVFDMGQVLIRWDPALMTARLGVPAEDAAILERTVFGSVEWIQMDRGIVSKEEVLASVCRDLPERLHTHARELIWNWWKHPLVPIPRMEDLIAELKGLGYRIYLLSNASTDLHQFFHRIPGSQYFDGKIVSADWKLLKPQPELYMTLFREYKLKPEECFFVDDLATNMEGAWYTGMDGAVFDGDMTRLRRKLNASGVPVKP